MDRLIALGFITPVGKTILKQMAQQRFQDPEPVNSSSRATMPSRAYLPAVTCINGFLSNNCRS
jgi:hypothetical protein